MDSLGPVGGLPSVRGGMLEPSLPFTREANKVNRLSPVPALGVPEGHPRSFPVQESHQVSLGGTKRAGIEEQTALGVLQALGRTVRPFLAR